MANGILPDGSGKVGIKKQMKTIVAHTFQCFDGDLAEADIIRVLREVKDQKTLLKEDASNKSGENGGPSKGFENKEEDQR